MAVNRTRHASSIWRYAALIAGWLIAPVMMSGGNATDWYGQPRPAFIEHCLTRNTGTIDRYRLCDGFFQKAFSDQNMPASAIFLRQRLIDLIPNYEQAAERAFWKFELASYAVLLLGIAAAIAAPVFGLAGTTLIGALAAALVAGLVTFGFNAQFKANFIAYRELTTLRDTIEVSIVQAASSGSEIPTATLDAWLGVYAKSVNDHATAFGGSFTNPR